MSEGKLEISNQAVSIGMKLPLAKQTEKPKALVVGLGRVGREIAKRLRSSWRVIAIDKDAEVVEQYRQSSVWRCLQSFSFASGQS